MAVGRVGEQPVAAVVGRESVWVSGKKTCRVSIRTLTAGPCRQIGRNVRSLALVAGTLWATSERDDSLYALDPETLAVRKRLSVRRPVAMQYAFRRLWVGSSDGRLLRIDPETGQSTTVAIPGGPVDSLAFGAGTLWAVTDGSARIIAVRSDGSVRSRRLPNQPYFVAAHDDAVWVSLGREVAEVDPDDLSLRRSVAVDGEPYGLAVDERAVWVALHWSEAVVGLERSTGRVVARYSTGLAHPSRVATGDGTVWAVDFLGGQLLRVPSPQ